MPAEFRKAPRADLRVIAVRLPSSTLLGHWLATRKWRLLVRPMALAAAGIRGVPDKTQARGSAVRCDVAVAGPPSAGERTGAASASSLTGPQAWADTSEKRGACSMSTDPRAPQMAFIGALPLLGLACLLYLAMMMLGIAPSPAHPPIESGEASVERGLAEL